MEKSLHNEASFKKMLQESKQLRHTVVELQGVLDSVNTFINRESEASDELDESSAASNSTPFGRYMGDEIEGEGDGEGEASLVDSSNALSSRSIRRYVHENSLISSTKSDTVAFVDHSAANVSLDESASPLSSASTIVVGDYRAQLNELRISMMLLTRLLEFSSSDDYLIRSFLTKEHEAQRLSLAKGLHSVEIQKDNIAVLSEVRGNLLESVSKFQTREEELYEQIRELQEAHEQMVHQYTSLLEQDYNIQIHLNSSELHNQLLTLQLEKARQDLNIEHEINIDVRAARDLIEQRFIEAVEKCYIFESQMEEMAQRLFIVEAERDELVYQYVNYEER